MRILECIFCRLPSWCRNLSSTILFIEIRASIPCLAMAAASFLCSSLILLQALVSLFLLPATFITFIWLATLMFPVTTVFTDCWKLMFWLLLLLLLLLILLLSWLSTDPCPVLLRARTDNQHGTGNRQTVLCPVFSCPNFRWWRSKHKHHESESCLKIQGNRNGGKQINLEWIISELPCKSGKS